MKHPKSHKRIHRTALFRAWYNKLYDYWESRGWAEGLSELTANDLTQQFIASTIASKKSN